MAGHTDTAAAHTTMLQELRHGPPHRVRWNGETDALGHGDNRRVEAHDLTLGVQEGAP